MRPTSELNMFKRVEFKLSLVAFSDHDDFATPFEHDDFSSSRKYSSNWNVKDFLSPFGDLLRLRIPVGGIYRFLTTQLIMNESNHEVVVCIDNIQGNQTQP